MTETHHASAFVTAAWLAHASAQDVVIVDCRFHLGEPDRGREQYREGHIPGAFYADLERDLSGPLGEHGGRHPLPSRDDFAKFAAGLGVGPETHVVAYDEAGEMAARCWWLFRYFSHDRASVLEGGFRAWLDAGLQVVAGESEPTDGTVGDDARGAEGGGARIRGAGSGVASSSTDHFAPRRSWLATHDDVRSAVDQRAVGSLVHLVDSRAPERYRGEVEPLDPIAGHIPGARNIFWGEAYQEPAVLRPHPQLRAQFGPLLDGRPIVVYCGSGVTASANALALHELGIQARVYAGSFSDWCSYDDPVATGEERHAEAEEEG